MITNQQKIYFSPEEDDATSLTDRLYTFLDSCSTYNHVAKGCLLFQIIFNMKIHLVCKRGCRSTWKACTAADLSS